MREFTITGASRAYRKEDQHRRYEVDLYGVLKGT
jgi:hypothetical protein